MSLFHITRHSDIPLMGCLYFGVVDRGSNLLQIRPSCGCNLNCPFCSVDAGPHSKSRVTDYQVELDYLMEAVEEIAPFKGPGVECHIDSPGEPTLYPDIVELVERLKQIKEVAVVSMQSNGTLLRSGFDKSAGRGGTRPHQPLHSRTGAREGCISRWRAVV